MLKIGNLKKYDPSTGKISLISNKMPSDKKAGKRQANNYTVQDDKNAIDKFMSLIMSLLK
jgi:hypothetical protein